MYSLSEIKKKNGIKPKLVECVEEAFKVPSGCTDEGFNDKDFLVIETLFVDSSGFGREGEAALTVEQFKEKVHDILENYKGENVYGAITGEGQFQVYITLYQDR